MLSNLERYFPKSFDTYYEPFLGGGAVFFHLVHNRPRFNAVLSDANRELVETYCVVKNQVEELIETLRNHESEYKRDPRRYYYSVRTESGGSDPIGRAARLIFLNKTCYNGLYRVNKKGQFNVPFGRFKNPKICDQRNLRTISKVLVWSNVKLTWLDYQIAIRGSGRGDFIYFDPPYHPTSSTANFTNYTGSGFSIEEQEQLGLLFRELDERGCQIVLSNSDTHKVRDIYEGYDIQTVEVLRAISCRSNKRKGHTELIISNLDSHVFS